jgi:hypothetical protein
MKRTSRAIFLVVAVFSATAARAGDDGWTVAPGLELAYKSTTFGTEGTPTSQSSYKTVAPSLAFSKGKWFAVLRNEFTIDPAQSESLTTFPTGYYFSQLGYKRTEVSLNGGYRLYDGRIGTFDLFAGILSGDSRQDIYQTLYDTTLTPALASSHKIQRFGEVGPFVGVNYAHPFGKNSLSFNLAFALLQGNLDVYEITQASDGTSDANHVGIGADSGGVSLGVLWSGPMAQNMAYRVGYKVVSYRFNVTSATDLTTGTPLPPSIAPSYLTETIGSLYVGASLYF